MKGEIQATVVSPTLCPLHCSGNFDVTDVSAAIDGIVDQMPLFRSGVHSCYLAEQCVGDGEVVLSTETQQHETV